MSAILTALPALVALVLLSTAVVGLAQLASRIHQRDLATQLLAGVERMLAASAVAHGR